MHPGSILLTGPQSIFDAEPPSGVRRPRLPLCTPLPPPGGKLGLGPLWEGLVSGQLQLCPRQGGAGLGAGPSHELRIIAAAASSELPRAEHVELLSQFLRGKSAKGIAFDTNRSAPAASRSQSHCLRAMGFAGAPSRSPVLLALAAHAAAGATLEPATVGWHTEGAVPMLVLCGARVDADLEQRLSPNVLGALRLFIDGLTHQQIAARLGKSPRTITNQLQAATRKLQGSGRFGVIARLVQLRESLPKRDW